MRMSSSMRWRNGLIPWLEWVMALLLLRNEAACLVPNMETEPVSSHLPPELNRSPLPRERFRPSWILGCHARIGQTLRSDLFTEFTLRTLAHVGMKRPIAVVRLRVTNLAAL